MLFDTEFLICASGQRGKRQRERSEAFLRAHLDTPLYTSRVCWAEFAEGCETLRLSPRAQGANCTLPTVRQR